MDKTIYLVWHYDYEQSAVQAAYEREEDAEAHAERRGEHYGVEEIVLRPAPPTWRPYFHGMAQIGCRNPVLDKTPFVERGGETDRWEPDPDKRVSTCPGNCLIGDDHSLGDAVWLSVFDMDPEKALGRVAARYGELLERRKANGYIPDWATLTREEFADA